MVEQAEQCFENGGEEMSYSEWRKRTKLFGEGFHPLYHETVTEIAKAAYLAGERAGLKRGEELCKKAIELAAIMRGEK